MENSDTRKVLVIKDVPSNVIEEAILILKSDSKNKKIDARQEKIKQVCLKNEAQDVINDYIRRMGLERQRVFKEIEKKHKSKILIAICAIMVVVDVVLIFALA